MDSRAWFKQGNIAPQPRDLLAPFYVACPSFFVDEFLAHYCGCTRGTHLLAGLRNSSHYWRAQIVEPDYLGVDDSAADCIRAGDIAHLFALRGACFLNYTRALCAAAAVGRADICKIIRGWMLSRDDKQLSVVPNRTLAIIAAIRGGHEEVAREIYEWDVCHYDLNGEKIVSAALSVNADITKPVPDDHEISSRISEWCSSNGREIYIAYNIRYALRKREYRLALIAQILTSHVDTSRIWNDILEASARDNDIENVTLALEHGADAYVDALSAAVGAGHLDMCKFIETRAHLMTSDWFLVACKAGKSGKFGICEYVLSKFDSRNVMVMTRVAQNMMMSSARSARDSAFAITERWIMRGRVDASRIDFGRIIEPAALRGHARIVALIVAEAKKYGQLIGTQSLMRDAARSGDIATWRIAAAQPCADKVHWQSIASAALHGGNGWIIRDMCTRAARDGIVFDLREMLDILADCPIHPVVFGTAPECMCLRCKFYRQYSCAENP